MKIAVDCGHTLRGSDTGAEGCGRKEQDLTREVGSLVIKKLRQLGHEVINCTVDTCGSVTDSLSSRVNTANNNRAEIFICIHFNCGGGHGTEVFTYNGQELPQARNVLNNICSLGYTNRGIKSANLYVINHTNMPAMLIECSFIDSQDDMNRYNANDLADAIVKGVVGQTVSVSQPAINNVVHSLGYSATVRDFQIQFNEAYNQRIYVDGLWGQQVEAALHQILLRNGSQNSLVGFVQCRVGTDVDYIYGNNTEEAVRRYQSAHGLTADGIVGFNTMKCILNEYKDK